MPAHYELREDPDAIPYVYPTCAAAERAGRKLSKRNKREYLLYEVDENGEGYLGTVEA